MTMRISAWASLGVLGLLGACASEGDASERTLLFDLSDDEVEAAIDAYAPGVDREIVTAQLQAPFDCVRFGDACARLGPERAEALLEEVWELARTDAPAEEIEHAIASAFTHASPVAALQVDTNGALCSLGPQYLVSISVSASKSSFALFSAGSVSYHAQRQSLVGPAPAIPIDHAVDATLSLDITTLTGTSLFSGMDMVTGQAEASYGRIVPGPFFVVDGEVDASGCPPVAASI